MKTAPGPSGGPETPKDVCTIRAEVRTRGPIPATRGALFRRLAAAWGAPGGRTMGNFGLESDPDLLVTDLGGPTNELPVTSAAIRTITGACPTSPRPRRQPENGLDPRFGNQPRPVFEFPQPVGSPAVFTSQCASSLGSIRHGIGQPAHFRRGGSPPFLMANQRPRKILALFSPWRRRSGSPSGRSWKDQLLGMVEAEGRDGRPYNPSWKTRTRLPSPTRTLSSGVRRRISGPSNEQPRVPDFFPNLFSQQGQHGPQLAALLHPDTSTCFREVPRRFQMDWQPPQERSFPGDAGPSRPGWPTRENGAGALLARDRQSSILSLRSRIWSTISTIFGAQGARPPHPELLDGFAGERASGPVGD